MNTDAESQRASREPGNTSPISPSQSGGETIGQTMRELDAAEDDLKQQAAEAKEKTEEAGHRLAGPLDE